MTNPHEYNENQVFTNEETYKALVSHFNQIEEIAKNKKFEWEDEELTETYSITYDFDEWFKVQESFIREFGRDPIVSEFLNLENGLNHLSENINQLKDYVDAFLLAPVGMYNGKVIQAKSVRTNTEDFNEVTEFLKELKENNKMVFLYQIYENRVRPKEIEIDGMILPQDLSTFYKIRYGVLND